MKLYGAIDLHSNNAVCGLIDTQDQVKMRRKTPCELDVIVDAFAPFKEHVFGIAVESTFNWYWLVDGLMDAGYRVHLVNTCAVKQYEGLKHTDDDTDAFWLAHLLRLGILPTGHIYAKETRALRDLLRKRSQLVQLRTTNILSLQNLYTRNTGARLASNAVKRLSREQLEQRFADENLVLAAARAGARRADRCAGGIDTGPGEARPTLSVLVKRAWGGQDLGADHHAGDRGYRSIQAGRQLHLLLPLCREHALEQWEKERQR